MRTHNFACAATILFLLANWPTRLPAQAPTLSETTEADTSESGLPTTFLLVDENEKRTTIGLDELQKLPRMERAVTDHGETIKYEGVALSELLKHYGVTFGETLRGPRVDLVILLKASDKYRASFTLAEIDPDNTDKEVILADRSNGKLLSAREAPVRVIVPSDKRQVRWIRNVQEIHIVHPTDYLGE